MFIILYSRLISTGVLPKQDSCLKAHPPAICISWFFCEFGIFESLGWLKMKILAFFAIEKWSSTILVNYSWIRLGGTLVLKYIK